MAVKTKRLARFRGTGAGVAVAYGTPAGDTAIVKDLRVYNASAASRSYSIGIRSAGIPDVYFTAGTLGSGGFTSLQVWIVLAPGDQLIVNPGGTDLMVWVSGTELSGVAL